jgi:DNA-binding XRE family transcriptional regulator
MAVKDEDVTHLQVTRNRIQKYRLTVRPELSQEACGRLVGVSKGHWQRFETKNAVPNTVTALRIAALFQTTVEEIFIATMVRKPKPAPIEKAVETTHASGRRKPRIHR